MWTTHLIPPKSACRCIAGLLLEGSGLLSVAAAPGRWLSRSGEHFASFVLRVASPVHCTSIHQSMGYFVSYSAGGSATLLSPASITTLQPSGWMLGNVSWAPGMWRSRNCWVLGQEVVWWELGSQNGTMLQLLGSQRVCETQQELPVWNNDVMYILYHFLR